MHSIKIVNNVCGLSFSDFRYLACERHIRASSDCAARTHADNQHDLYEELLKARSHTSIRSRSK